MQNTEKRLKSKTGDPWRMGSAPPIRQFLFQFLCAPVCTSSRHQQHTFGGHQASAAHVAAAAEADAPSCCCALRAATATLKLLRLFENGDKCKVYCGRAAAQTDGTWCRRLPLQLAVAGMGAMLQGLASPVLTSAAHTGMPVSPSMSTYGI